MVSMVPEHQARYGPGDTPIMAAFIRIGFGSRFTDGQYGGYYGARELRVALGEVSFHRARFMEASKERPTDITMRQYMTKPDQGIEFSAITKDTHPEFLNPDTSWCGLARPSQHGGGGRASMGTSTQAFVPRGAPASQCCALMPLALLPRVGT